MFGGFRVYFIFVFVVVRNQNTLYDPRFFTEHASLMLRPAGTVMFSMTSVNSGSSGKAARGYMHIRKSDREKKSENQRNYEMN